MSARDDYPNVAVAESIAQQRKYTTAVQFTEALDEIDRLRAAVVTGLSDDAIERHAASTDECCRASLRNLRAHLTSRGGVIRRDDAPTVHEDRWTRL